MSKISYAGYRFPPVIIQQAVWLYARFTLSFRDVEDLLAERGIMVCYLDGVPRVRAAFFCTRPESGDVLVGHVLKIAVVFRPHLYNCIAYAAGEMSRKWRPVFHPDFYWRASAPRIYGKIEKYIKRPVNSGN